MRWFGVLLLIAAAPAFARAPQSPTQSPTQLAPMRMSPPVPPPVPQNCTLAEHRQLDFWVGDWDVVQTAKPEEMAGGSRVESINFGCGIRETWSPFTSINGSSLSTFDPRDKTWHQSWIDANNARVEFEGGVKDGAMVLTGLWRGIYGDNREATMRITLSPLKDGTVRQVGEISADGGATWQPSFDLTYVGKRP